MKNMFRIFMVAMVATAMMFSSCNKDDDKNEPEVTPTPVVEEPSEEEVDAKLEKFDISNSQFGVANATETTISVEWKEDEVKFDSVKLVLLKTLDKITFENVSKNTIKDGNQYTFTDVEKYQMYKVQFNFYSNNKICTREYTSVTSNDFVCDGSYWWVNVSQVAGLNVLFYSSLYDPSTDVNTYPDFKNLLTAYGKNLITMNDNTSFITEVNNVVYGYHLITNKEFEIIEKAAGVSQTELSNAQFEVPYGNEDVVNKFRLNEISLNTYCQLAAYRDDDGSICARWIGFDGITRYKNTLPLDNCYWQMIFVKD